MRTAIGARRPGARAAPGRARPAARRAAAAGARGARARASATRCCSPPDSVVDAAPAEPGRPTSSSSSSTRAATSWSGRPCIRRPKATLPATSRCGNSAWSWNIRPTPRRCGGTARWSTPSSSTAPPSSGCRPATTRRSVDFPHPLGPSTAITSPGGTSRSTSSSAGRPPKRTVAPRTAEPRGHSHAPWRGSASPRRGAVDDEHRAAAVMTIRTTLRAIAWPTFTSPGRPRRRSMATGTVGRSARAMTAWPRTPRARWRTRSRPPRGRARRTRGRSTSRQARQGEAPSTAAASRSRAVDRTQDGRHRPHHEGQRHDGLGERAPARDWPAGRPARRGR